MFRDVNAGAIFYLAEHPGNAYRKVGQATAEFVKHRLGSRFNGCQVGVSPGQAILRQPPQPEEQKIVDMSQEEMCRLHRFAPLGHPYFDSSNPLSKFWEEEFKRKGGFTPAISKRIGWDK